MITGEDLYKIASIHFMGKEAEYAVWGRVSPWIQNYYDNLAQKLNEQFIAPLLEQMKGHERALQFKEEY